MSTSNFCKACDIGTLVQQTYIRKIYYKGTILHVKEVLFECNECGAQPSTTSLIEEHKQNIIIAKSLYDDYLNSNN